MGGTLKANLLVIFATAILILMPVLSSAEFYSILLVGKDGAPGYLKPTDSISIKTESMLPISVDFTQEGNFTQMSCDTNNPIRCTYTKQIANASAQTTILLRESGSLIIKSIPVYIDINSPTIESANFYSAGNKIGVNFDASDGSLTVGKCSGIKQVDLLINGKSAAIKNFTREQCRVSGSIEGSIANIDANVNSSIMITDYMGYKTNKSYSGNTLHLDSISPRIASQVAVYKKNSDEKINSLPKGAIISVDIMINVTEDELELASASFIQLNGNEDLIQGDCESANENNASRKCVFRNVEINIQNPNQKAIFFAKDVNGNIANLTTSLPITLAIPRFSVTVGASNSANDSNITKIPGPNSSKTVGVDLEFTARYDSPLKMNRIIVEASQISLGSDIGEITNLKNSSSFNGSRFVEATSCESDGNLTLTCVIKNAQIRAAVQNPKLTIYGIDEAGVVSMQVAAPLWNVVLSAGKVVSILPATEKCLSGTCYLSSSPQKISAIISTTSTFSENGIKINGVNAICTQTSASWVCNATVAGTTNLALQGFDDFGNSITGQSNAKIIVDSVVPTLTSQIATSPNCPTSSESLVIQVNATDSGGSPSLIISTNPTEVSTLSENQTKSTCTPAASGMYSCILKVGNLKTEGLNSILKIKVTDLAGNFVENEVPVSICSLINEAPNAIKQIKPVGILPKIDRKVASKILTLKVPVGLSGELNAPNAAILEKSKISCNSKDGVSDAYLINEDSSNPTLVISLKYSQSWKDLDSIVVNCNQDFKIRIGNQIYSLPEKESFNVNLELFNNPLGTLDEAYNLKLSTIKQEIRDSQKTIDRWQKVDNYVGKMCDTAKKLAEINAVIQNVKIVFWAAMNVVDAIVPGTGEALWQTVGGAMNNFHKIVSTHIWPQGWFKNGHNNFGLVIKYSCSIYACKYYDMQTYMSIGMEYLAQRQQEAPKSEHGTITDEYEGTIYAEEYANDEKYTVRTYSDGTTIVEFENKIDLTYSDEQVKSMMLQQFSRTEEFPYEISEIFDLNVNTEGDTIVVLVPKKNLPSKQIWNYKSTPKIVTENNPQNIIGDTKLSTKLQSKMPKSINRLLGVLKDDSTESNAELYSSERFDMRLNSALDAFTNDASTWIYNPYKSEHYDNLCIPAVLYNSKKKQQLLCKQLGCIQEMTKSGGPIEACEFDYELASCMYVESARHKLEADSSAFKNIARAAWSTTISNVAGIGTAYAYMYVFPGCAEYQTMIGSESLRDASNTLKSVQSIKSLACGTIGTSLSINELKSTFNGNFNRDESPTIIPGPNFCAGVNYND